MNELPLDVCPSCKGNGYDCQMPCFGCEGTGFKYGKGAEAYQEYLLDISFNWHTVLMEILVESFGFPHPLFIPKDAEKFVMNYFARQTPAPPKEEVRQDMLAELGEGFFANFRPFCFGHVLSGNRILVHLSLAEAPESIEDELKFLNQPYGAPFDLFVDSQYAEAFLAHVQPAHVQPGVIQFSKEAWANLPDAIVLEKDLPFTLFR